MLDRYNLLKRFKEWLNQSRTFEVKAFNLHTGAVEINKFPHIVFSGVVLEETLEPKNVCEHGNCLAVTFKRSWLTSLVGNDPKGKKVNMKWLRRDDTENECAILIEGTKN